MSKPNSGTGANRSLRKSSTLLSSRRDAHRSSISSDGKYPPPTPLRIPSDCFDVYSRPQISPTPFHVHDLPRKHSRKTDQDKEKEKATEPSYAFPTVDLALEVPDFLSGGDLTPRKPRHRTRTGPSSIKSKWKQTPTPPLRLSGASSHAETPPQTPIDSSSVGNCTFNHFPVFVSAPVAGVEAMDALVDGMNGFTMEDFFGKSSSSRSRFGKSSHHSLFPPPPPLPTPPPGIVLGKGKSRRQEKILLSDEEDDDPRPSPPARPSPRRTHVRPSSARNGSSSTITVDSGLYEVTTPVLVSDSVDNLPAALAQPPDRPRTVVPSISEIIRNHAPAAAQIRRRESSNQGSSYTHSSGHSNIDEDEESELEHLTTDKEVETLGRSSIDSIADEVRRTYHNQTISGIAAPFTSPRAPPLTDTPCNTSDSSSHGAASDICIHTLTASARDSQHSLDPIHIPSSPTSVPQAIAEYLRSSRLTTLLKLTRFPHASLDHPLTVSLADMGDPNGFPLVVFLGLGCVRHVMGLYDEMADCLGLRLIAIDRWGLGRTEIPHSKSARGIMEWAAAVEEVLDQLHINECSVVAHSAGAPYALSFANRAPNRIRGDLCLLAPWIGGSEGGGYRWLKYVPNGILKTAQAAEWKIQAWMLGKPPTVAYRGIGYTAPPSPGIQKSISSSGVEILPRYLSTSRNSVYPSDNAKRRMSLGSVLSSDYDDLRDFDGRFGSQSTLGARSMTQQNRRKPSRGILGRLKSSKSASQPPSPAVESTPITTVGKTLKTLRSMGSLKGKASATSNSIKRTDLPSPRLPQPLSLDTGLGLDDIDIDWGATQARSSLSPTIPPLSSPPIKSTGLPADRPSLKPLPRQYGRRSISFSASSTNVSRSSPPSLPSSPPASTYSSPHVSAQTTSNAYQAALGNALIAASHAEASKGTHSDLLQILNHDNRPWGFSYGNYPHKVQVWYGDKDEKIAENAVRWMEKAMGEGRCHVKVVKGADHALMYKSSVVVEVLEQVREFW